MANQRRARRLKRRIIRLRARQEVLRQIDELGLRVPLVDWIRGIATRHDLDLDRDDDGDVDFEDLVDAAIEVADALVAPGNPLAEFASDVGLAMAGRLAVTLYSGSEGRLQRRIDRLERRVAQLMPDPVSAASP